MGTPNKRRSRRVFTDLKVRWIRTKGPIELRAIDMNLHGMFLCTDERVGVGELLHVEVLVPGGPLKMFVRVRFCGPTQCGHGIGVELHLVDSMFRARWSEFYQQIRSRFLQFEEAQAA